VSALASALREVWGLFVDDASFTVGILICLVLAIYVFPHIVPSAEWRGPLLFGVLGIVLVENVYRSARK
jgi:hypothetical protein